MSLLLRISVLCLLFAFQSNALERVFEVNGIIRGKLADGRPVIEHEEIPGYMMAMTMVFNVSEPAEIAALKEGDKVRFTFRVDETSSVAEHFRVTGKSSAPLLQAVESGQHRGPLKEGDAVPGFELVDENESDLDNQALKDHFTVVTFMFTRCPVPEFCPLLATKFSGIQNALLAEAQLASQVKLLSITLDPEFDTPAVLAAYGQRVGADPALWNFATGKPEEIKKLALAFGVTSNRSNGLLDHSLTTALIGQDGRVIKLWPGNRWQAEQVLGTIRSLDKPASCCSMAPCSGERP